MTMTMTSLAQLAKPHAHAGTCGSTHGAAGSASDANGHVRGCWSSPYANICVYVAQRQKTQAQHSSKGLSKSDPPWATSDRPRQVQRHKWDVKGRTSTSLTTRRRHRCRRWRRCRCSCHPGWRRRHRYPARRHYRHHSRRVHHRHRELVSAGNSES